MAIRFECDMCGADVPAENQLQPIVIGGEKVGDGCFNCAQALKSAIKSQVTQLRIQRQQLASAAKAAQTATALTETLAAKPEEKADQGKSSKGGN